MSNTQEQTQPKRARKPNPGTLSATSWGRKCPTQATAGMFRWWDCVEAPWLLAMGCFTVDNVVASTVFGTS